MSEARKAEHLRISLEHDVGSSQVTTGLERYRFVPCSLPESSLHSVDLSTTFLGRRLTAPLLISSMTGGTLAAERINHNLAIAAQAAGIALGLGSLRAGLEAPELLRTYQVRHLAPDLLLLANLGAVQLNAGLGPADCQKAVDVVEADALVLHLNPLQEALQADGNTDWRDLLCRIAEVCRLLAVPVVVKEVGWGITAGVARRLVEAGVSAIDVAGAGGTSWSRVELHRAPTERLRRLCTEFADWGLPTADALTSVRQALPSTPLIASGGLRSGMDVAKVLALGADLAGMAAPFLQAADLSPEAALGLAEDLVEVLRRVMFCAGAVDLHTFREPSRLERVPA